MTVDDDNMTASPQLSDDALRQIYCEGLASTPTLSDLQNAIQSQQDESFDDAIEGVLAHDYIKATWPEQKTTLLTHVPQ